MKRLSKLFLSIFVLSLWLVGAYSRADATWMTITLTPWWNVVSTPALLSNISFSNWGDGISFSKLESGLRVSIVPNIETLKPLEWFLVENTNSSDVEMAHIYSDNVSPTEAIFQKNLDLWRNFLGITTNVNPFNNIVWSVNMTMDFTYGDSDNLLNSVNSTYAWNQNSSIIVAPQYWEAYWAFITSRDAIYWWINNKDAENGVIDPNWFGCTMEELKVCVLDDDPDGCLSLCRNRWVDITIWNNINKDSIVAPWEQDVILLDFTIMTQENLEIQKYELSANWELNFSQFTDWKVTLLIDGMAYDITGNITNFSSQQDYFSIDIHHWARIMVVWNILNENEFTGDYTNSIFEFKIKQVKNLELNKEISWLSIKWSWHETIIIPLWKGTICTATKSAPVTTSLFANKDQEIARFAVKASSDNITVKTLEFVVTADWTIWTLAEMSTLLDENLRLVNVENNEEVDATFDFDTNFDTNWLIHVKDMNLAVAKDATVNLKVMANVGSIEDVMDGTVKLDVTAWKFKTSTTSLADLTLWTTTTNTYTFRATAPEITLAKVSDNMFELTIKNLNDTGIVYNDLKYRVRTDVANSDFSGRVCLVSDVNVISCEDPAVLSSWALAAVVNNNWTTAPALAENDEVTYYIFVDGISIVPDYLRVDISELSYGTTIVGPERYSLSLDNL